ncbi:hypothetical protein AN958_07135 [Leucoagaricus sp. SymC.cos]|nr:hypothetical protein AN958_07135 [Leucoagaricus sp. SymC.cos]
MAPRQDLVPVASIREQIFRVDCASFAAYVVLYYDYLLTLGDEIHLIWSAKQLTLNALVFYANRYIVLFGHIPLILGRYLLSEQSPVSDSSP